MTTVSGQYTNWTAQYLANYNVYAYVILQDHLELNNGVWKF